MKYDKGGLHPKDWFGGLSILAYPDKIYVRTQDQVGRSGLFSRVGRDAVEFFRQPEDPHPTAPSTINKTDSNRHAAEALVDIIARGVRLYDPWKHDDTTFQIRHALREAFLSDIFPTWQAGESLARYTMSADEVVDWVLHVMMVREIDEASGIPTSLEYPL